MSSLLKLSSGIDRLNQAVGKFTTWLILIVTLISAGNAIVRKAFNMSSNGLLEIQWYLFAAVVMLGASQVLRINEHVRVDVLYGLYGGRGQAIVDLLGFIFFLMCSMSVLLYYSWPLFIRMYLSGEMSNNAGGLIRWPVMLLLPVGFALILLQGLSEIIKRLAWLNNSYDGDFHYERPLQ